jgi:hypothetical protein
MVILIQLLCSWIFSIVLYLFKAHSISETGFCLRLHVEHVQLGAIDRASPYLRTPAPTQDRIYKYIIKAQHKPSVRVKTNIKNI